MPRQKISLGLFFTYALIILNLQFRVHVVVIVKIIIEHIDQSQTPVRRWNLQHLQVMLVSLD